MPSGNWSSPLPVCESKFSFEEIEKIVNGDYKSNLNNQFIGVECGDIPILASSNRSVPRVSIVSREVGGRASFSCHSGYGIRGPSQTTCLSSGEWAQPFPTCTGLKTNGTSSKRKRPTENPSNNPFIHLEVQCEPPGSPNNGIAQGSPPYRAGDVVQFNCNPEFMMQGQPIIACQDNGRWSGVVPKCTYECKHIERQFTVFQNQFVSSSK